MRAVTVIGVLLAAGAGTLRAQHAHQLEIGGFGSYSRYDKQFNLDNQFGGGGRLAFYFNDYLGLEVDGNLAYPFPKTGGPHTQVRTGSASLVINGGGAHNVLYVLGGASYIDMGVNPPYNFHLLAGHGGLGDRIFLTDRLALRLEARAYFAPKSCCLSSTWVGHVMGSAGLSFFIGGGGPHEVELPPPIPKEKRDSIIAAGGKPPEAPRPTRRGGGPDVRATEQRLESQMVLGRPGRSIRLQDQLRQLCL